MILEKSSTKVLWGAVESFTESLISYAPYDPSFPNTFLLAS